jgi:hypothetical protein
LAAEPDGSLRIDQARYYDSGVYTCSARNRYGSSSAKIRLNVVTESSGEQDSQEGFSGESTTPRQVEEFRVRIEPKSYTVELGGEVEFRCKVLSRQDDEPATTLKWSRYGGTQIPANHRVDGNSLLIRNVQENDGGNYLCTAQARDGKFFSYFICFFL